MNNFFNDIFDLLAFVNFLDAVCLYSSGD